MDERLRSFVQQQCDPGEFEDHPYKTSDLEIALMPDTDMRLGDATVRKLECKKGRYYFQITYAENTGALLGVLITGVREDLGLWLDELERAGLDEELATFGRDGLVTEVPEPSGHRPTFTLEREKDDVTIRLDPRDDYNPDDKWSLDLMVLR